MLLHLVYRFLDPNDGKRIQSVWMVVGLIQVLSCLGHLDPFRFFLKTTLDLNPTILAYQTKLVIWCHFSTMFRFAGNQPLPSYVLIFFPWGCWLGICELATKHLIDPDCLFPKNPDPSPRVGSIVSIPSPGHRIVGEIPFLGHTVQILRD